MPTYRIIDKDTRRTVHAYSADAVTEFAEYPLATFDHVETVPLADGSVPATVTVDGIDLPLRLTTEEAVAILGPAPTADEIYTG